MITVEHLQQQGKIYGGYFSIQSIISKIWVIYLQGIMFTDVSVNQLLSGSSAKQDDYFEINIKIIQFL